MSKKISYLRVRDGKKLYGWLYNVDQVSKAKSVRISYPNGESQLVVANKPLPEWARKLILAGGTPKSVVDSLPSSHGFFEQTLNERAIGEFGQICVADQEDDQELAGSPVVAFGVHDVEVKNGQASDFVGIPNEQLQRLDFRQFKKRILARQAEGLPVLVHPPFISWNIPLFQRPQHMALAFARAGAVSIYFTDNHLDNINEVISDGANLYIVPPEYFDDFLNSFANTHVILYSTSPQQIIPAVNKSGNRIVYEYVDHIDPKISADWIHGCLNNLNAFSDSSVYAVVSTARLLQEEMHERFDASRVALIPNGVSCTHFQVDRDSATIPTQFREIVERKRPVVGYYGAIAPWLDYGIIEDLADLLPDHDFVYIGPLYLKGQEDLPRRDNIFWYGQVDYTVLPHFAVWFDCCFIPFEPGQIAATTSPLKLFEYFSLGKPVVVTSAMKECVQFPIVRSGRTARQLATAIKEVLGTWGPDDAAASRALAQEHDWQRRAEAYLRFISDLDTPRRAQGVELEPEQVFVAPHTKNLLAGALGYELLNDEMVFIPNGVKLRSGGSFGWRVRLPAIESSSDAVVSFGFRMAFGAAANSAECEFSCGSESLRFQPFSSDQFKTFRLRRPAGCDELVLTVRARADLLLHLSNAIFKITGLSILPADADVYCNHAPIVRGADGANQGEALAQQSLSTVFAECDFAVRSGNVLAGRSPETTSLASKSRPAEIALGEILKGGEMSELVIDLRRLADRPGERMRLRVCAPHFNPQGLGRVFYYVAVDGKVVYHEDVSAFSGLNDLVVKRPHDRIQVGVLASDQVGNWKWGAASKIQVFDIELGGEFAENLCSASSKAGVIIDDVVTVDDFLREMSRQPAVAAPAGSTDVASKGGRARSQKLGKRALSVIKKAFG